jgi:hypothetical protein
VCTSEDDGHCDPEHKESKGDDGGQLRKTHGLPSPFDQASPMKPQLPFDFRSLLGLARNDLLGIGIRVGKPRAVWLAAFRSLNVSAI